jgi:hypothetical protein
MWAAKACVTARADAVDLPCIEGYACFYRDRRSRTQCHGALRHDQGVPCNLDARHVKARGQLVIRNCDLGEDVFVKRDRRLSTPVA